MDGEGNALAVGLLADNTLDVDGPLQTVDAGDLALTALVGATDNGDLVVLADGDGADLLKSFPSVPGSIAAIFPILLIKTVSGPLVLLFSFNHS